MLALGSFRLHTLDVQYFRLDGGSVFGVVPKVLWEKVVEPDDLNRVRLSMRMLLARSNGRNILVDAAMGTAWSEKMKAIYGLSEWRLDEELANAGIGRDDITDVVFTHLHFDHVAGAFEEKNGRLSSVFPNARFHVQRRNLETALSPNLKEKPSYIAVFVEALAASESLNLIDGPCELFPGFELMPCGEGHTAGHQLVKISGDETTLVHAGDLVPSSAHLGLNRVMALDILPLEVINEKTRLLGEIIDGNGILYFAHDPFIEAATIRRDDGRIVADRTVRL
ncbi:metal-dependent hydrolase [Prosthecochloris sp. GSB1]|uniref:MBL fold metallo-hydrolase n=1 Tax=Prosthecochloris sp. GSB1 TaxID=281093 RepID=UPI000B8CF40A|nr:MBL fold metallo-hydrolase [Prosthecochloris sp. GSB1]ASQ90581.1 metal-dependent hydrolase [Prosthecochloris sp. GSB1]